MNSKRALATVIASCAYSFTALAGSTCEYYRSVSPSLYESLCGKNGTSSRPVGAQSSMSESVNTNAASLPTGPTSYGIETLYSAVRGNLSENTTNFGLVKGFKRHGAGLSIGGGNTFYDNDLLRRQYSSPDLKNFNPYQEPKGKFMNLNLGAAVNVYKISPAANLNVGGSLRYQKSTNTWGGGPSMLFNSPFFVFGVGLTRIKIASDLARVNFISSQVGLRLFILELEYNRLDSQQSFHLGPVHIFTASLRLRRLILTAAFRQSRYRLDGYTKQEHYAIQYLVTNSISLSYMDNYIPGTHSVGLQLFL